MKAAARHGEEAVGEGTAVSGVHEPAAGEGTAGSGVHEPAAAIGEARSPPPWEWTGRRTV
jgi:hypothetical protein